MTQQSSLTATPQWVKKSDQFSNAYIQLMARLDPEQMGQLGFQESDERIIDLAPGFRERKIEVLKTFIQTCHQDLQNESDPHVQQDLEILLRHARNAIREIELRYRYELPYLSVGMFVFSGLGLLLDERNDTNRHQAALVRLQRYTGLEAGYQPLTHLVMQDITALLNSERIAPMLRELENDRGNTARYVEGMRQLFERFQVSGFDPALVAMEKQLTEFDAFIQKELLPRARQDHRLPAELYAFLLENNGVDLPPVDLARKARLAFKELQAQMQVLAREVAASQGLNDPDYRAVLKELKKDQVPADAVVALYKQRLVEIEALLKEKRLVTVPARAASIRLATEAESARVPNPYLDIPRLIGNQGEQGVFVIPMRVPAPPGEEALQLDDFSFAAASWSITAHEARPGHELQFATMIEQGVSLARAIFSFNSTNCEGWALYCEYLMRPYMPLDAQLITLQLSLMRAARAFLDPEIQLGLMTPEEAFRLLKDEVCLSDAMAHQEVDRYTFRMPGQATTYFYGFMRMLQLRSEVEAHRASLDLCAFHDFILAQGLVPPDLLRQAVRTQYGLPSLAS